MEMLRLVYAVLLSYNVEGCSGGRKDVLCSIGKCSGGLLAAEYDAGGVTGGASRRSNLTGGGSQRRGRKLWDLFRDL